MRRLALLLVAAIAASHVVGRASQQRAAPSKSVVKALVGGTLVDGFGGRPLRNSVVLIDGERISAVGQVGTLAVPAGADVISTEGMTVLPGLWDMHVHLMINGHSDYAHWDKTYPAQFEPVIMPASAKQLLLAGVTSARDLGGPLEASISVRDRIKAGKIPGASVYVSGPFIQKAPYPGTELFRWGVTGRDDARAKVKKLADAGVDVDQADRSGPDDDGRSQRRRGGGPSTGSAGRGAFAPAGGDPPRASRRESTVSSTPGSRARPSIRRTSIAAIRERTAKMSLGSALLDADDRRAA